MTVGLFAGDGDQADAVAARLAEVRALGATDVSLVVTWVQDDLASVEVRDSAADSAPPEVVRSSVRAAHALGLRVLLFPLVRLQQRTARQWRGLLRPRDVEAWFASYRVRMLALAELARDEHVEVLSIGSELVSLEREEARFRALIAAVRRVYRGQLLYSANWDRYDRVPFFDALDLVGISAYWELTAPDARPTVDDARRGWAPVLTRLRAFSRAVRRPIVFTEVGYPSVRGAGAWPWNDFLDGAPGAEDAEVQRRLYEAFAQTFGDEPLLAGVYFWLWTAPGGLHDRSYSPRGKPAALVLRTWFRAADALPPPR